MPEIKNKIVKSYYLMGNLPIYNNDLNIGSHDPQGCDFVINTRLKYELGICSMQFIRQKNPSVYNIGGFQPEIEMDLSSMIRLKRRLLNLSTKLFEDNKYIQLTSTKLQQKVELQKNGFIGYNLEKNTVSIIIDDKKQEVFYIKGDYQIECFSDLIELSIESLSRLYGEYDLKKQHTIENPQHPQTPIYDNTVVTNINVPPPVEGGSVFNKNFSPPPPKGNTTQVIVQAPAAPKV